MILRDKGPGWNERDSSSSKTPAPRKPSFDQETQDAIAHEHQRAEAYERLEKALKLLELQESYEKTRGKTG